MEARELLAALEEAKREPMRQHRLFREADPALLEQEELHDALLWWHARYDFADKKNTRIRDRFVWLLMFVSSWGQQGNYRRAKDLHKLYDQVMCTDQLQAALAHSDRLYDILLDACSFYVDTLAEGKSVLGLMRVKDKSPEQANLRISRELCRSLLLPLGVCCREKPHADQLVRALVAAAVARYQGIRPHLIEAVEEKAADEARAWLLGLIHQETEGLYGGKGV